MPGSCFLLDRATDCALVPADPAPKSARHFSEAAGRRVSPWLARPRSLPWFPWGRKQLESSTPSSARWSPASEAALASAVGPGPTSAAEGAAEGDHGRGDGWILLPLADLSPAAGGAAFEAAMVATVGPGPTSAAKGAAGGDQSQGFQQRPAASAGAPAPTLRSSPFSVSTQFAGLSRSAAIRAGGARRSEGRASGTPALWSAGLSSSSLTASALLDLSARDLEASRAAIFCIKSSSWATWREVLCLAAADHMGAQAPTNLLSHWSSSGPWPKAGTSCSRSPTAAEGPPPSPSVSAGAPRAAHSDASSFVVSSTAAQGSFLSISAVGLGGGLSPFLEVSSARESPHSLIRVEPPPLPPALGPWT